MNAGSPSARRRLRAWWRRAMLGLPTVIGLAPRGWFIPYRYAGETGTDERPYAAVEAAFEARRDAFLEVLAAIGSMIDTLGVLDGPPPRPRWSQDWFPGLDGAAAFALMATRRPRRVIEVGSGHSTRFLLAGLAHGRAASGGLPPAGVTCIDPAPRADLAGLDVALHRTPLQHAIGTVDFGLAPGDVLFVDSSHIAMPGSDVDIVVNHLLPDLPAGVLVHVHDVFLPDPYPESWRWRGYNEQIVIAPLVAAGRLVPVFSSHWARTRLADRLGPAATIPLPEGAVESSLWLETA